ncbi:MAG: hypothetical protein MK066_12360 [Crocinitomicaceae bacterium]|nr:hypothetical protein [Crocinitomicaceae bacterium]
MKNILFGFIASTLLLACSPKTTTEVITESSDTTNDGMPKADIAEGKVVYLKDCGRCHYQKSVDGYTKEQWSNILPRMAKKAELDETETRQIEAYITWELDHD